MCIADVNITMLNALVPESEQYSIKACDSRAGHITLSDKRADVLKIAIGARVMVMLTTNVDVADGVHG